MAGARVRGALGRVPRAERAALAVLAGFVLIGIALRIWFMYAQRPGYIGFPDTSLYIAQAKDDLFAGRLRVVGYSVFLRGVHGLSTEMSAVTLVQHAMGVAGAVVMYATTRRIGGQPWIALVPAGALLLFGGPLFMEHALLSEALFAFLLVLALYAAVRAVDGRVAWAAASGLALGLGVAVRVSALPVVLIVALWLLWARGGSRGWWPRIAHAGAVAATAAVVVLIYASAHDRATGQFGLTRTGAFNSYARVVAWADCREFDPPSGTEFLCESRPESERPPVGYYLYDPNAPAVLAFGNPDQGSPPPEDMRKLRSFARAAVVAQPLDYLRFVGRDLVRFVAPASYARQSGPGADQLFDTMASTENGVEAIRSGADYYTTPAGLNRPRHERALRSWERVTRLRGPLAFVLIGLALVAPLLARGRLRAGAWLMLAVALALTIPSVLTLFYAYRYTIPATGPLAAAAAIGAYALAVLIRSRSRRAASVSS